jgi:hypothetical protein
MSKKPIKEFLTKIQDSLEVVKQAKPLEIVAILVKDYGFLPKDACKTTANLIKQANNQRSISDTELHELYLSSGGDYPITKQHRFHSEKGKKKAKKYKFYDESKIDFTPRDQQIINRWEFPPEPVGKQTKWPYAAAQIDTMKPKNKARRGGLGGGTFESKNINEEIPPEQKTKIENIKPEDRLIVYHGTSLSEVDNFINGFDATQIKPRQYGGPKHNGVFISSDPDVAEKFASYGEVVLEIEVRAKNLHGVDYSGNIGRKQNLDAQTIQSIKDRYPNSFRPYLSMTMLQSNEPQGLLIGLVKPQQIKRVRYKKYKQEPVWYSRNDFVNAQLKYKKGYAPEKEIKDLGIDASSPKLSVKDFITSISKAHGYTTEQIIAAFERRIKRGDALDFIEQLGLQPIAAKAMEKKLRQYFSTKTESAKEPLHQIRMGPGKRVRKPGGDWGGSQGIQSMPTPHAKDNPTSVGNVISTTGAPGWSKSLPNKEFDPPINNFLSGEREREKTKKYKFKKLEAKELDEKQRFAKEKGEKFQSKYISHFYKKFSGKNDSLLFAHFTGDIPKTRDPKIGLNPRSDKSVAAKAGQTTSTFNTPLGIYAYPVFAFEEEDLEQGFVPFGGDRKNIILFTVRQSSKNKIIIIDEDAEVSKDSPINQQQAEEVLEKTRFDTKGGFRDWSDEAAFQTTVGKLWNITRMMSNNSISRWAKILRDLGVDGIVDMGSGMIHNNELHQAVFFGKDIIQVLGVDKNQGAINDRENLLMVAIDSDDPIELHKAAKKGDLNVGSRASMNKNINYDTQLMLVRKWGQKIYDYILINKNLDPRIIMKISKTADLNNWRLVAKITDHPNTPKEVFAKIMKDGGVDARASLATNDNTPVEILKQLVDDENEGVRILAQQYLERRTGKTENKKTKTYKYDLSKIPEREKPQKVGQPLPVAGWTGGMDPLKKSGRKI